MRVLVSWIGDDGSASAAMEWMGFFQEGTVPVVGDRYVESFGGGLMGVARVEERYTYLDDEDDEIWHLFLRTVEVPPDRRAAFQIRAIVTED
jgi:hypothetical protein